MRQSWPPKSKNEFGDSNSKFNSEKGASSNGQICDAIIVPRVKGHTNVKRNKLL